jgi:hypothetical protein
VLGRNPDTRKLREAFPRFSIWSSKVRDYIKITLSPIQKKDALDLTTIDGAGIYIPIVPLMEAIPDPEVPLLATTSSADSDTRKTAVLPIADLNGFLGEQKNQLQRKNQELQKIFPPDQKNLLITCHEG